MHLNRRYKKFDQVVTHRICNRCKKEKSIDEFYFLKSGNKFSSYCKYCDSHRKKKPTIEQSKKFYKENRPLFILKSYKKYDKGKKLNNNLTIDYILDQLTRSCVYCSYPSTGLDRIDNSLGHIKSNCVPCCKECNIARMNNFTHQEMFILGSAIKQIKDNR